ncbi:transporter [Henriciella sp.]|uniref:transporter n=1 Tax=Henriciella sp. TaxID=1968823 RepID=UPI00261DA470|nr:transporter [Henriciella sp.]
MCLLADSPVCRVTFFAFLLVMATPVAAAQSDSMVATSPAGPDGQVISTFYYSNSESGFDGDGDRVDISDYEKIELYLLTEYSLSEKTTLVLTPSFRSVSVEGNDEDSSGLGYFDIGLRQRLSAGADWSFSVQGTARIPGNGRRDSLAQVGNTDAEYDLRGRYIRSFSFGTDSGFIDVQGSYRFRAGDPPNEMHADFTAGYRPSPDLLVMAQSFNTFSDGRGRGIFDSYRYHNVQLSLVKDVTTNISLQLGALATLAGENALRERGVFGGVWVRF